MPEGQNGAVTTFSAASPQKRARDITWRKPAEERHLGLFKKKRGPAEQRGKNILPRVLAQIRARAGPARTRRAESLTEPSFTGRPA